MKHSERPASGSAIAGRTEPKASSEHLSWGMRIDRLRAETRSVLDRTTPSFSRCALIDFQDHWNVGDSALWLGSQGYLREKGRIAYTCDLPTMSPSGLRRLVGNGPVFLNGGGSFGDVWGDYHQRLRERVIRAMPDNPIVQLPQSVFFSEPRNIESARAALEGHSNFTLLVRDRASHDFSVENFDVPVVLCPDVAFGVGLRRPSPPSVDILWLARVDREAVHSPSAYADEDVEVVDWWRVDERSSRTDLASAARSAAGGPLGSSFVRSLIGNALRERRQNRLAEKRVATGAAILARGRVVITDRLHGHILCLLLGIPHVLLDNSYGKVRAFHRTWTHTFPDVEFADTPEEALSRARALVATVR